MNTTVALPDDLIRAAQCLEARFDILQYPTRNIPESEWDVLPADIQALVPSWYIVLLRDFRLHGGLLFYPEKFYNYHYQFSFWAPEVYPRLLMDFGYHRLVDFGFFPMSGEDMCPDVWVVKANDGPSTAVYRLVHSAWGGVFPTAESGLVLATSRLSLLFASMAVEDKRSQGSEQAMWKPRK
jgi:hypothetical protein